MMKNWILPLVLCFALPVQANEWVQVGEAKLKVAFLPIYDSSLYTLDGDYEDGEAPVKLRIQYRRSISSDTLLHHTRKEWQGLAVPADLIEEGIGQLSKVFPDVKKGDTLSVELLPGGQSRFLYNAQPIQAATDPHVSRHFLDIWLSANTSRPKLRDQLLGNK